MQYNNGGLNFTENFERIQRNLQRKEITKIGDKIGVMLILFVVISQVLSVGLFFIMRCMGLWNKHTLVKDAFNGQNLTVYYVVTGIVGILSLIMPLMLFMSKGRDSLKVLIPIKKVSITLALPLYILGLATCFTANIETSVVDSIIQFFGFKSVAPITAYNNELGTAVPLIIAISIIPGIMEELVFRGAVLGSLRKYGDIFAVSVSSVIFALMHTNLQQMPFALVVGFALGLITVKTNSLVVPILVHMSNNFISSILTIIESHYGNQVFSMCFFIIVLFFCSLGAYCVKYLIEHYSYLFSFEVNPTKLKLSSRMLAFCESPAMIILLVICIVRIAMSFTVL